MKEDVFYVLYICAGLTDILDGYLARRLKQETHLGAKLDSIADVCLMIVLMKWVIRYHGILLNKYQNILLVLFVFKLIVIITTSIKYKEIAIMHTIGNKILGFSICLIPFIPIAMSNGYYQAVMAVTLLVIIEEFVIVMSSISFNINRKSIFRIAKNQPKEKHKEHHDV